MSALETRINAIYSILDSLYEGGNGVGSSSRGA